MDSVFYADDLPPVGAVGTLSGPEGKHAATVRRLLPGERLIVADGRGTGVAAEVVAVDKGVLDYRVLDRLVDQPVRPTVTVVQGLPKSERSELAVDLATEAGVDRIVPWQAGRSVARWDTGKAAKGVARWRAVATAAAKQSRRLRIPEVTELHRTGEVGALVRSVVDAGGVALALHESGATALRELDLRARPEILLIVGPEGGISDDELAAFTAAGAIPTVLGPTVLRTSTAAAVALGALGVLTDRWDRAVSRDRG